MDMSRLPTTGCAKKKCGSERPLAHSVVLPNLWLRRYMSRLCFSIVVADRGLQILLEQRYGRAVDWWAFGVLTYEMLLGQSPFRGDDEDEIFDAILEDEPLYPITMPRDAVSILQKVIINRNRIPHRSQTQTLSALESGSTPPSRSRRRGRRRDQTSTLLQGCELRRCSQQTYTPSVLPHNCKHL